MRVAIFALGPLVLRALAVSAASAQARSSRIVRHGADSSSDHEQPPILSKEDYRSLMQGGQVSGSSFESLAAPAHQGEGFLGTFVDHFMDSTTDTATFLYSKYLSLSRNSSLAYTVTSSNFFQPLAYALHPENRAHTHIRPLSEGDEIAQIVRRVYIPPRKRMDGVGQLGVQVEFGAWEIEWRGVGLRVYVTTWPEGYLVKTQSHIMVTSLPDRLSSLPSPDILAQVVPTTADSASVPTQTVLDGATGSTLSADQVADLFFLDVTTFNSRLGDIVLVFDQGFWNKDPELWQSVQKADWKDVVLDDEFKRSLQHEYKSFFASEETYKDLGVPWKRGIIFLGPPGNGKTITLKAIMKSVGVPILYVKSFRSFGGDETGIRQIFLGARQQAPCLLVFEDLDSLITDNNRSFFLNEVDGLEDNDGILMIATTNHFDKLDPALSNRPSRFDRKYFFPNPTEDERAQYARYWQDKLSSLPRIKFPDDLVHKFAAETKGFSYAYMKESFVSTLLFIAGDETGKVVFEETLLKQVHDLRKELETAEPSSDISKKTMLDFASAFNPTSALF